MSVSSLSVYHHHCHNTRLALFSYLKDFSFNLYLWILSKFGYSVSTEKLSQKYLTKKKPAVRKNWQVEKYEVRPAGGRY